MKGIERNQGQLRTALIIVCGQLDQGDESRPVTVDELGQIMEIGYVNADALMRRLAKDGLVTLTRGRFQPTQKAYDHDLVGGAL